MEELYHQFLHPKLLNRSTHWSVPSGQYNISERNIIPADWTGRNQTGQPFWIKTERNHTGKPLNKDRRRPRRQASIPYRREGAERPYKRTKHVSLLYSEQVCISEWYEVFKQPGRTFIQTSLPEACAERPQADRKCDPIVLNHWQIER